MEITTPRMGLIPGTTELLRAELEGRARLEEALGVTVPASWPPELFDHDAVRWTLAQIEANPDHERWGFYYFLLRDGDSGREPVAVGAGGYKGPPSRGAVEIGYSVLPEFRRRGIATEAALGLVAHAFADESVSLVAAETLPGLEPSIGVLRKLGFHLVGEGSEPGVIRYHLERAR